MHSTKMRELRWGKTAVRWAVGGIAVLVAFPYGSAAAAPPPPQAAIAAAADATAAADEGEPLPIVQQWSGSYSAQDQAKRLVVRDAEGWKQLWRAMHGRTFPMPEPPEVDFQKHMVLAAFQGQKPTGGYAVRISGVVQSEKTVVRVQEHAPGPGDMVTMALTSPYHVVVVPRRETEVEFVGDLARPGRAGDGGRRLPGPVLPGPGGRLVPR